MKDGPFVWAGFVRTSFIMACVVTWSSGGFWAEIMSNSYSNSFNFDFLQKKLAEVFWKYKGYYTQYRGHVQSQAMPVSGPWTTLLVHTL